MHAGAHIHLRLVPANGQPICTRGQKAHEQL